MTHVLGEIAKAEKSREQCRGMRFIKKCWVEILMAVLFVIVVISFIHGI